MVNPLGERNGEFNRLKTFNNTHHPSNLASGGFQLSETPFRLYSVSTFIYSNSWYNKDIMASEIPKNTKNTARPYKKDVYDAYATWRSIPACMRHGDAEQIGKDLTTEDARFGKLLSIKNQSDFAKKYGVENSTLTNWNKLMQKNDPLSDVRKWGKRLTKNILWSLYTHVLEDGDADSARLWFQIVEGWKYRSCGTDLSQHEYRPITFNILLNKPHNEVPIALISPQ